MQALIRLRSFQNWLQANGYAYLEDGLATWDVGDAILEIAKRAGIRGLRGTDVIVDTLPMVQDLIRLRCKPLVSER